MRLRTRFLFSLLALSALMTVPAIYAAVHVRQVREIALDLRQDAARTAVTVGQLRAGLSDLDRLQRAYVVTADPDVGRHMDRAMAEIRAQADSLTRWGYGDELSEGGFPLRGLAGVVDSLRALVEAGELEAATRQIGGVARPLLRQGDAALAYLSGAIDRATQQRTAEADAITAAAARATTTAILLALLAAVGLAWLASRLLTRPLDRLRQAMSRVAEGHFDTTDDDAYDRPDEVGELFRSFRTMAHQLAELDRMKAEFVGIASHDLKTPISVITGYAELMEEELSSSLEQRHRQLLHSLWEQTRALGSRVNQLIEISRMESGGLRLGLEEINVRHFARSIETEYGAAARSQGIQLSVVTDAATPSFLVADPDCLHTEILGNLVGHALKFAPGGGHVEVRFGPGEPGRLVVEVEDDGPGVSPEDAPHIFDRYFSGRSASGRVGSGLGLPIARAGVLAHGGTMELLQDPGPGATFRIDLPLRPMATPRPSEELQQQP